MAIIFPTLENIKRLKTKPTEGESFLLHALMEQFSDDENVEIYFQPFLNGDRPDIILMKKNVGVTIIEVKDWDLAKYEVDIYNKWYVKNIKQNIKSPFQQVFAYKENLFSLHINGLLEKKIINNYFNERIQVFVYFHKVSENDFKSFYADADGYYAKRQQENVLPRTRSDYEIEKFNKESDYIKKKKSNFKKDFKIAIGNDTISKIKLPPEDNTGLFSDSIYKEFQRYLQPPFHTLNEGKEITYTSTQQKYIVSRPVHEKIRGVAGSGKTALMAKRAVDAHTRHGERVLILTYNLTLKSYIHDKISDVRENFKWDNFYIINYHEFFKQIANYLGIDIQLSDEIKKQLEKIFNPRERDRIKEEYFEKMFYSNLSIFDEYAEYLDKYQSIFIDEIQDYKSAWIKLIRKYFTNDNSELILFGDEKQNIYERSLDTEKKFTTPQGFGEWKKLKQSIRQQENGNRVLDLLKKFQKAFFSEKYELDEYETGRNQKYLDMRIFKFATYDNLSLDSRNISLDDGIYKIVLKIFAEIRANHIHPNDVCILSSRIATIQKIDFVIRNSFNEETITTFESIEIIEKMKSNRMDESSNLRRSKKIGFNLNSGVIKLSTIHSFKGFESKVVFLIINNDEVHEDAEELIYAGISRSKSELMIFSPKHSRYNEFFSAEMNSENTDDNKKLFEELKECVAQNMNIDIQYEVHGEIVDHTHVKPYKILFMNENFYLACEVNNKYKFTMFRISKIRNITLTENIFYKNPDIVDFINDIQTPFAKYQPNYKDHLVEVKVEVHQSKADFFKTKQFLPSQEIVDTKENGNLILVFTVTQELEIEELIKKWLPYMKVIEPISLDEKIKSDIKKYLYA